MTGFARAFLICGVGVLFAALAIQTGKTQDSRVLVIEGGTLIDGNGGAPIQDALVVIRDNKIESVSRKGQGSYPSTARVLRGDGKFILPGLMDAHIHHESFLGELFLNWGVTSVFEVGSGSERGLVQREAVNRGKIVGPRLFLAVGSLAGARIAALGGLTGVGGPLRSRSVVSGVEQARERVRLFIQAKADMIKVHRGPPFEIYQAAAEEAHKVGLPLIAQPLGPTVYAREAVLAGADILEHAAGISYAVAKDPAKWKGWGEMEEHSLDPSPFSDMDENKAAEMIRLLVDRKVYLEPDLICQAHGLPEIRERFEFQDYRVLQDPNLTYIPLRSKLKWLGNYAEFEGADPRIVTVRQKGFRNMLRFIGEFAKAGGKVMAATDTSGGGWAVPGIGLHHELELLRDAGLSPMQVILAATRNNAEGFRVLNRLGTIEPGKLADVIVVKEDPLQDIRNLQKLEWVIQDGRIIERGYHSWYYNPFSHGGVEGETWVAAVKKENESMRTPAFGQPPPAIETISPTLVTQGDPAVQVVITGVGFTSKSTVFFESQAIPAKLLSSTQLRATVDAALIQKAGSFALQVVNPEPFQRPAWGGTSNKAYLLVNFRYP